MAPNPAAQDFLHQSWKSVQLIIPAAIENAAAWCSLEEFKPSIGLWSIPKPRTYAIESRQVQQQSPSKNKAGY
ncbi:MAG: hypothetical protein KME15_13580 [Drouetiella hepatica Uher 2000/2452]|jgi:hypothetical protein|uniref:Uncharacterized protein n=1 Tax=Drouetiella hepatica Uher 2000/2452 TaxID=904376 RepID=A0A951QBE2_9CYAN|nr:hypothetical protein [Drouetiella hepatica Uher 2000/2452]